MITIDYSEREKVEKMMSDLDIVHLMDTQAIPYTPGGEYYVSSPIPAVPSSAYLLVNGVQFTAYTLSGLTISFIVPGQFNLIDTMIPGENTILLYLDGTFYQSRIINCKNLLTMLLWIAGATDYNLTKLSTAFSYTSLQTMPANVAAARFATLLPRYFYLTDTEYKRILIGLFTGAVFGGSLKGLRSLMEGFLPSALTLTTILRELVGANDALKVGGNPIPYREVNFDSPITASYTVGPTTTTYVYGTDFLLRENDWGFAIIDWLNGGASPTPGVYYDMTFYWASYVINPNVSTTYWKLQDRRLYEWCDKTNEVPALGYSYCNVPIGGLPGTHYAGYCVWEELNKIHYFLKPMTLADNIEWAKLLDGKNKSMGYTVDWYGFVLYQHLTYKYQVSASPVSFETGLSFIIKDYAVGATNYPLVYYYLSDGVTKVYLNGTGPTPEYIISRTGTLTITGGIVLSDKTIHIELYFVPDEMIRYCESIVKQAHVKIVNIYYNAAKERLNFFEGV